MPKNKETSELIESRDFFETVEYRAEEGSDKKKLRGYSARFNQIADLWWFDEEIMPGAFRNSIKVDDIRGLVDHKSNLIIGRNKANTLELKEDKKGLYAVYDPPDTTTGRDIIISVQRGDVTGQSFAFRVNEENWISGEKRGKGKNDLRQIKDATLRDVSIVTYPVYDVTDVSYRNNKAEMRSLENIYKHRFDHIGPNLSYYRRYFKRVACEN